MLMANLLVSSLFFVPDTNQQEERLSDFQKFSKPVADASLWRRDQAEFRIKIEPSLLAGLSTAELNAILSFVFFGVVLTLQVINGLRKEKLLASLYPFHSFP